MLQNIDFELQQGQLLVVVGPVGAGKSSLLAAIMGEMSGSRMSASIAGTARSTLLLDVHGYVRATVAVISQCSCSSAHCRAVML